MTPDFLICLECESPVYIFEWDDGRVLEAQCTVCGNDEPSQFATEEDVEEMTMGMGVSRESDRFAPEK